MDIRSGIEILENNYSGSSVEIDELGETPVQLRLDNTGDMINQTIKKTSLVLSIIDTDQFDYSQFYTSDGKKYKVNLISSVANWTDRKSTRLNSSHSAKSRMPSSA